MAGGLMPSGLMPSILLNSSNAALPGVRYPMLGLGTRGAGYMLGQKEECWRFPVCCTQHYCPAVNATRDWLQLGGWRIDTDYPFGDTGGSANGRTIGPNTPAIHPNRTCGGRSPIEGSSLARRRLGHFCNPHGTRLGIEESGVRREDIFITIKTGSAGPMQEVDLGDRQGPNELYWLGIDYADLYLMHEGDLGNAGHHPSGFCEYPTTAECRRRVFLSCIDWMAKGFTRACGVANWELEWLQELKDSHVTLPSVVQIKFHLHQSLASPRIAAIKAFCDAHGIVFNGYSPLGRADWTRFVDEGMAPTLLEEPVVLDISRRVGKSAAQVLLRWHVQQGIPTNPRSMRVAHMKENLAVFSWALTDAEMHALSNLPQCNVTRGDPFMKGDPEARGHVNMIGPTLHC